jgi:hypothetical protein
VPVVGKILMSRILMEFYLVKEKIPKNSQKFK